MIATLSGTVTAKESDSLLQDGKIDAYFYTAGHPNGSIKEAVAGKNKVRIVSIDAPEFLKENPWFSSSTIAKAYYPKIVNETDIKSIGVKATLMTSSDTPDDIVYALTKEVMENLETFKKGHDAFSGMNKENMLKGLAAPLHPGAEKYYKEAGILK